MGSTEAVVDQAVTGDRKVEDIQGATGGAHRLAI